MKNIRVIVKSGKYPGKKIVVLAGVHGDEICGVKAFNELVPILEVERGEVVFIYANLEAQKQNRRFVEQNLNRCFLDKQPEEIYNSLEGETAREIIPFLKNADVMLDLHSSNSSGDNKFLICEKDCLDIISCFDAKKVIIGIDTVEKGGTDGYMFNRGKPGICLECGLHESDKSVETAKKAILSFLKKLKAIEGKEEKFVEKELYNINYLYKNKNGPFKLADKFEDFKKVEQRTLIGYDGSKKVFVEKNDVVMFPNETSEIGEECFLILRSFFRRNNGL
jgi:uncharacterized protein